MKITKVINVPAQTKTVLDKMVCDLCGLESRYDTLIMTIIPLKK